MSATATPVCARTMDRARELAGAPATHADCDALIVAINQGTRRLRHLRNHAGTTAQRELLRQKIDARMLAVRLVKARKDEIARAERRTYAEAFMDAARRTLPRDVVAVLDAAAEEATR